MEMIYNRISYTEQLMFEDLSVVCGELSLDIEL